MSIRAWLFPLGATKIERELYKLYSALFKTHLGVSSAEARVSAKQGILTCREQARKEGTIRWFGLGNTAIDAARNGVEPFKSSIEWARREGATDDDIRWWWNMHDLERRTMVWAEDVVRGALFLHAKEEDGLDSEQAAADVRKNFPMYGHHPDAPLVPKQAYFGGPDGWQKVGLLCACLFRRPALAA